MMRNQPSENDVAPDLPTPELLKMRSHPDQDLTQLLQEWHNGDSAAMDQLMPIIYDELRYLAHLQLRNERPGGRFNTTELVHEAYLTLVDQQAPWQSRKHFYAIASRVMRRVLIWYARKRKAAKRGGDQIVLPLDDVVVLAEDRLEELLSLDQALTRLEALDERLFHVVEYRYFGGLSVTEIAEVMNLSPATIKRDWKTARAWLRRELDGDV